MPCMGPTYSKQEANEAYKEIMALLVEKYKILPEYSGEVGYLAMREFRLERKRQLQRAIHDLFELDACESF